MARGVRPKPRYDDPELVWCLVGRDVHARTFDDATVVFSNHSGDTHLIGPLEAGILGVLLDGAATAMDIAAKLAPRAESAPPEPLPAERVTESLRTLHLLELIDPATA